MSLMVELKNIRKNYASKEAVRGISLEIPAGELFVLVGPNGAGKTTTLKTLVGLLKPTSGTVVIGGFDISQDPMKAKNLISFVPDTPYVYEKLTPWELLRFVGKLYHLDYKIIESKGRELLQFFELEHVQDSLIEEFSHGMRQKVILSAALLHEPKLFILDEPMVGLDPMSIKKFKDLLRKKAREGMTIIFSSHHLSMAEELADRVGIIDQGQWVALGTMKELQSHYQSKENLESMFMRLLEKEEIKN